MNVGGSDTFMIMPSLVNFDFWKHVDILNIQKLNQQGRDQQTGTNEPNCISYE